MLVLSRKTGQRIQIGDNTTITIDNTTITIIAAKGRTVRVGIKAPSDVRVLRSELTAQLQLASSDAAAERYQPPAADR